ncbi:MAG: type III pantothenate kinase [Desulfovibrio sp.]|nr:type III pantothenate kinase [Desulfovibrio sp.]
MDADILVCDIGNTSIKISFAHSRGILASFALPSKNGETGDSLGLRLLDIARFAKIEPGKIKACVAASVVPSKNGILRDAVRRYLGCPCLFAPVDLPIPLRNEYDRPFEAGADRLVGAWAARKIFPDAESLIVIDFGTAVTFDCVAGRSYKGGLIFPGLESATRAMSESAAKLPEIDLDMATGTLEIDRDTATSMRCGLLFGYAALAEGLISLLEKKLPSPPKIVLTGGRAKTINDILNIKRDVVPNLILDGLRFLYYEKESGNR